MGICKPLPKNKCFIRGCSEKKKKNNFELSSPFITTTVIFVCIIKDWTEKIERKVCKPRESAVITILIFYADKREVHINGTNLHKKKLQPVICYQKPKVYDMLFTLSGISLV